MEAADQTEFRSLTSSVQTLIHHGNREAPSYYSPVTGFAARSVTRSEWQRAVASQHQVRRTQPLHLYLHPHLHRASCIEVFHYYQQLFS